MNTTVPCRWVARKAAARAVMVALLATVLAACASGGGKLIRAGSGIRVLDLQVDSNLDWARMRTSRAELWTIDGLPLNEFVVISRVRANEHVFLAAKERKRRPDGPWYRPGMRPDEIRDVILDALRQQGWTRVESSNLRPARYGAVEGLRFEAELTQQNGLRYKGTFGAAENGGRLTHFFWIAPTEYYHARDSAAVNQMFESIRFIQ